MPEKEKEEISSELETLLGLFNVNAALSDRVPHFCDKMTVERTNRIRSEFLKYLENGWLGEKDFYNSTACSARNEKSARQFFWDVYTYAFEGGKEPDVRDYWNR